MPGALLGEVTAEASPATCLAWEQDGLACAQIFEALSAWAA